MTKERKATELNEAALEQVQGGFTATGDLWKRGAKGVSSGGLGGSRDDDKRITGFKGDDIEEDSSRIMAESGDGSI